MTRGEMLERMSSPEYSMWVARYDLGPFGPEAEALRAGQIAAAVLNSQRGSDDAKVWEPADFFPFLQREPTEEDEQEKAELLEQKIRLSLGAVFVKPEGTSG